MPLSHRRALAAVAASLAAACGQDAFTGAEHETAPIKSYAIDEMDLALAATGQAASAQPMSWHGGLGGYGVQLQPKIYLVLWGSQWKGNDASAEVPLLKKFYLGLSGTSWVNTLTQYCQLAKAGATACAGSGVQAATNAVLYGGAFADDASPAPANPTQAQIAAEAIKAAKFFGNLTAAANVPAQYVVATPHGLAVNGFGTQWCAWHSATSSPYGNLAYTLLPYLPDAGGACGANAVNPGAAGLTDGVTIVAGHEFAETVTDQWVGTGWFDAAGAEIGDKCAWVRGGKGGMANVRLGTGVFALQSLWSNAANGGVGGCVQSYP